MKIDDAVASVRKVAPPGTEGLAERVTRRLAKLQQMQIEGFDVEQDLAVLHATAKNLDEQTRAAIAESVSQWIYFGLAVVLRVGLGVQVPPRW